MAQGGSCSYGALPKSCDAERQSLAEGDICVLSPETQPRPKGVAKKESYRNPVPDVFMR